MSKREDDFDFGVETLPQSEKIISVDKQELARLKRQTAKIEAERLEKKQQRLHRQHLRELREKQTAKSWWVIPTILISSVLLGLILMWWGAKN